MREIQETHGRNTGTMQSRRALINKLFPEEAAPIRGKRVPGAEKPLTEFGN